MPEYHVSVGKVADRFGAAKEPIYLWIDRFWKFRSSDVDKRVEASRVGQYKPDQGKA
jgi:hypothetical protein